MPNPTCPICQRELPPAQGATTTTARPFCSARCKTVDLGNWLGDGYVIAGASLELESVGDLDAETLEALLSSREPS